jgi:pimeloyl-ACP methyl ester carboxylesterase
MVEEQPALLFLFSEISACNPARTLAEMNAVIRAAGTLSPGDLASLTMPVLFLAGEEDIVIPPRVLELAMRHIPGARMEIVPRAGHSVYFERAEAFNAIVGRFLRA